MSSPTSNRILTWVTNIIRILGQDFMIIQDEFSTLMKMICFIIEVNVTEVIN